MTTGPYCFHGQQGTQSTNRQTIVFTVILMMLAGIAAGRIFSRSSAMKAASRAVTPLIWVLLFMLGIEVGGDRRITENIATLGAEATVIALAGVAGSAAAAWALWRWAGTKEDRQ